MTEYREKYEAAEIRMRAAIADMSVYRGLANISEKDSIRAVIQVVADYIGVVLHQK